MSFPVSRFDLEHLLEIDVIVHDLVQEGHQFGADPLKFGLDAPILDLGPSKVLLFEVR